MRKRLLPALCILLLLPLLLTACRQIEDTNGPDDISLCTLTEEEILDKSPSYSAVSSITSTQNGKRTLRIKKLSGVYALDSHLASGNTLTITLSTTLHEGNLRIVVLCDGNYVADMPVGQNETLTLQNADGHRYQVRLAAESAKLDATLTFTDN